MTNIKQENTTPVPGTGRIDSHVKSELPAQDTKRPNIKEDQDRSPPSRLPELSFDMEDTPESIHDIPHYSSMLSFLGKGLRPLEDAKILRYYGPAAKRLLLFDYDGTLTDIVSDPRQALLGAGVHEAISKLAAHPRNRVYIVSGRDQDFLQKEFGYITDLGLVAEHGAFMRTPTRTEWQNRCREYDMTWKFSVGSAMADLERAVPGSLLEEKAAALVWHFRNVDEAYYPKDQAAKLKKRLVNIIGSHWPVKITDGKCIVEARLKCIHKGQITRDILRDFEPDFVLCAGDDLTDEDMFQALNKSDVSQINVFPIIVGSHGSETNARWYLPSPEMVIRNIFMLNRADSSGDVEGKGEPLPDGLYSGSTPPLVHRTDLIR